MLIGINNKHQIKQVNNITDNNLIVVELEETAEMYPFKNWTEERIKCYCYKDDGNSTAIYPYINTDKIQEFENQVLNLQAQVIELEFEKIIGGMM